MPITFLNPFVCCLCVWESRSMFGRRYPFFFFDLLAFHEPPPTTADSQLKLSTPYTHHIADFGLARMYGTPKQRLSPQAITLWYKPAELLLGAYEYSSAADMWSVGTIFAELLLRRPFLQGKNDISQLDTIFTVFGTPNETNWPDHKALPLCARGLLWDDTPAIPFDEIFTAAPKDAISLLRSIMVLDPNMRFTASQSMSHPYFTNDPPPTSKEKLVLSAS